MNKNEELNLIPSLPKFPTTRYQGSKRKIIPQLYALFSELEGKKFVDLFSGSATVSLLARFMGKSVIANDYMKYNANTAQLFLNFKQNEIKISEAERDLAYLLSEAPISPPCIVSEKYRGIYFKEHENLEIDRFCQNIHRFSDVKRNTYIYAVGQALIKKRPYNLFHRANLEMRTKDVERSFGNAKTWETSIKEHAIKCISELYKFPTNYEQKANTALNINTEQLESIDDNIDVVYLDPPYINGKGISVDYSDFYNFLEGLIDYSLFSTGDEKYPHKPIAKKYSNWSNAATAINELERICRHWKNATIVLSYRSDGQPAPSELADVMKKFGRRVEIHSAGEYQYALSSNKDNEELFIIAYKN